MNGVTADVDELLKYPPKLQGVLSKKLGVISLSDLKVDDGEVDFNKLIPKVEADSPPLSLDELLEEAA